MTTTEIADHVEKSADAHTDAVSSDALHVQTAPVSSVSLTERTSSHGRKIQTDIDAIPSELKKRKRWVMWKKETRNGKPTKIPYTVNNCPAKADDSNTWNSFDVCLNALDSRGLCFDGIGYEFDKEDGIIGIDIDHCRNPHTRELNDWAAKKLRLLDSYAEISPSGEGGPYLC
ncbi:MAG: hypothetical protein WCG09_03230 [Halobacteriota archaeon]